MNRWLSLIFILIIGFSLTIALDNYYRQNENARNTRLLKATAERFHRIIQHNFTDLTATGDLKAFMLARETMPAYEEFTRYAAESKRYYPTIIILQYRNTAGKIVYSYNPDSYASTDFSNETGFLKAMERATAEKKLTLTSPLWTSPGHQLVIGLDPVYQNGRLNGYAEIFFDIDLMLDEAFASAGEVEGAFFVSLSDDTGKVFWQKGENFAPPQGVKQTDYIAVGDNFWRATIGLQTQPAPYVFALTWVGGLLITLLIILLVNGVWLRQQWLARQVAAKTAELIEKNETLLQARQAQAVASKLSTLGAMTAGISHEINQPLNSIKILSSGMIYDYYNSRQYSADEMMDLVQEISNQADRINDIIVHMRSLIKKNDVKTVKCSLNQTVRQVLHMLDRQIANHGIKLTLDLAENLPAIQASPTALEEVAANILINAIQILDERTGEKRISLRTYYSDAVYLEISDNGPGIKEELKNKIFEPFISTRSDEENMGLGLFIVHSIVSSYGGTIRLSSSETGTTFIIKLPLPLQNPVNEVDLDEDFSS